MKLARAFVGIIILVLLLLSSCAKDPEIELQAADIMRIPDGFPAMVFPEGNEYNSDRWQLGKKLFYDKRMSKTNKFSCASCHKSNLAFSDEVAFSLGENSEIGVSNAPSLTNIGYHPYYTRAGGVPSLEMHVLVPIQEHNEFNTNVLDLAKMFDKDMDYHQAALKSYGRAFDSYVLVRAIANFERSFISGNSRYDSYFYKGKTNALTASEERGFKLFNSDRTNCSSCHSGFNFTNYAFENNGLYEDYADIGRMRITEEEADRSLFKVPSLRNIAVTAPYMHDGSLSRLEDIIEHYNNGGKTYRNKSVLVRPLGLSKVEKQDLVNFLISLTDHQFIENINFKNE